MKGTITYNYLEEFTRQLQREGRYSFSREEAKDEIGISETALKKALNRLTNKGILLPVRKGFYVIIPPEYSAKQVLPAHMFIDAMMKYLEKPYYVGLLSAAAYHGAAHQAPQVYFVITIRPPLRNIQKRNLKISFNVKTAIDPSFLEDRKTETGYLRVSCPELTALDLLLYQDSIGGINRCFTIYMELFGKIRPAVLKKLLYLDIPNSVWQRFGYLMDKVKGGEKITGLVKNYLSEKNTRYIALRPGKETKGFSMDTKWKIYENVLLESDL